jgi:hypothetical protein
MASRNPGCGVHRLQDGLPVGVEIPGCAPGELARAEQDITEISEPGQNSGEIRMALAALRIAQGDPHAATVALAPVLSGAAPVPRRPGWRSPACWR